MSVIHCLTTETMGDYRITASIHHKGCE